MIKMDLISGTFKVCSLFNDVNFVELWFNPNPLTQPNNWDVFYRGERVEAERRIKEAVKFASDALKPEPTPETYSRLLFRSHPYASAMIKALEELNVLAEGSDEYNYIRDEWESILDRYIQCRHRYCGTCNGVGCEESVTVHIPNSLLSATQKQRDKAGKAEPTPTQLRAWQYEDEGRCHW